MVTVEVYANFNFYNFILPRLHKFISRNALPISAASTRRYAVEEGVGLRY